MSKRTLVSGLALAAAAAAWSVSRPPAQTAIEGSPSPPAEIRTDDTVPPTGGAPTSTDVAAALTRVFAGVVTAFVPDPHFLVADFNGDGSEDVAVNVRVPAPRLAEVNDDLANWVVEDVGARGPSAGATTTRIALDERLLAVIHGHGPRGWRCGEARQAYLLRNAPAIDELHARTSSSRAPPRAGARPCGAVLVARSDETTLFFTGARYAMSP